MNSLDELDGELGGRKVVGQGVLVHVEGGQSEGQLWLQFRGEALLVDVVAALHVQVVQGVEVPLGQFGGGNGHEGDAEQATQLVSARTSGNLKIGTET